jgi:hypothetical protein
MSCVDQISAKVSFPSEHPVVGVPSAGRQCLSMPFSTGLSKPAVQITPGLANQGLFIQLSDPSPGAGEVSSGG